MRSSSLAGALIVLCAVAGCYRGHRNMSTGGGGTYCQSGPKYGTTCYHTLDSGHGNVPYPSGPSAPPQERSNYPGQR